MIQSCEELLNVHLYLLQESLHCMVQKDLLCICKIPGAILNSSRCSQEIFLSESWMGHNSHWTIVRQLLWLTCNQAASYVLYKELCVSPYLHTFTTVTEHSVWTVIHSRSCSAHTFWSRRWTFFRGKNKKTNSPSSWGLSAVTRNKRDWACMHLYISFWTALCNFIGQFLSLKIYCETGDLSTDY